MRGKLIWKSLKTGQIGVAKLRLSDFHREERQRAAARNIPHLTRDRRRTKTFPDVDFEFV
jgi:hypothetical protein